MIDTHCHLADKAFAGDLAAVLGRARTAGVGRFICIADSFAEAEQCIAIADREENVFCAVGVHPHNAKEWVPGDEQRLRSLILRSRNVRAVGEIGLDYHYDLSPREDQKHVFEMQLRIAKDVGLPAVVHCRDSITELRAMIREVQPEKLVLHCCTERFEDVEPLLAKGYFLSFTGIATYPDADVVRDTIRRCPLEQLMVETDAPYLAPVPYRGKRNEPAFVEEVIRRVAEVKGMPFAEMEQITARNAERFFALGA
ncbi:MAG: TatD family hydrolase [Candidatus Peribacteraceae bacterium]|nr:TatD family hydrolase [Candidatus Peribacteraceae bacterium]